MSYTKTKIYNLALSALLLAREVSEVETETADDNDELRVLNTHWDTALNSTLQDLDLDSTSETFTLELLETLNSDPWTYVYKYPSNCAFFRRIVSPRELDTKQSHIPKKVKLRNGVKVIYTNEPQAEIEFIPKDVPLETVSDMAAMAIAYKLAILSAPLITGKGSKTLRESLKQDYIMYKLEAQQVDANENFNYEADYLRSEYVETRLS